MRRRLAVMVAVGALFVAGSPRTAVAADRSSLACIQSAEEGESARSSADLIRARELFTRCSARDCPSVLRRDCTTWLDETERQIPSVVLGAHDAHGADLLEAHATIDGVRVQNRLDGTPLDLNPGPHTIRFEGTGVAPVELKVVIRAGEKNRSVLAPLAPPQPPPATTPAPAPVAPPPPPPPPSPQPHAGVPWGVFAFGGLALAGFGTFTVFAIRGNSDLDHLHGTCAPGCTHSQVESVRLELEAADIALGVGAVATVAATWIGIRALTKPSGAGWELTLAPSRTGARAGALLRF